MYKAVAETLAELTQDEKYLGARIFSTLHIWGQNLHSPIFIQLLAGGLNKYNRWRRTSDEFLYSIKCYPRSFEVSIFTTSNSIMSKINCLFSMILKSIRDAYNDQGIPPQVSKMFQALIDECYNLDWYSYTNSGPLKLIFEGKSIIEVAGKDVTLCPGYKDAKLQLGILFLSLFSGEGEVYPFWKKWVRKHL